MQESAEKVRIKNSMDIKLKTLKFLVSIINFV